MGFVGCLVTPCIAKQLKTTVLLGAWYQALKPVSLHRNLDAHGQWTGFGRRLSDWIKVKFRNNLSLLKALFLDISWEGCSPVDIGPLDSA